MDRLGEFAEIEIVKNALFAFLCFVAALHALPEKPFAVDYGGRVRPLNSFELLVSKRLCESKKCAGISPDELFSKIGDFSADSLEVFRVGRSAAVEILHLDGSRRNFRRGDFEHGRSLLRQYAEREDSHPLTREFVRLNAALDIYDSLQSASFVERISVDSAGMSPTVLRQVKAERLYLNFDLPFLIWCASLGALFVSILSLSGKRVFLKFAAVAEISLSVSCAVLLAFRGIVENRLPFTSLYEMLLLFVAGVFAVFPPLAFFTRVKGLLACGAGIAVALLFVMRNALDGDSFAPVSMLLDSPFWLSLHVLTIACGFCLLLVAGLMAHVSLCLRALKRDVSKVFSGVLRKTLCAGFLFSTAGILLGGFWADVAWGRFWGWDPKENAALLVVIWVLIVAHLDYARLAGPKLLDALVSLLPTVIAFCLFGVNLLGVGLHSYGYSPKLFFAFAAFVGIDALYILFFSCLGKNSR